MFPSNLNARNAIQKMTHRHRNCLMLLLGCLLQCMSIDFVFSFTTTTIGRQNQIEKSNLLHCNQKDKICSSPERTLPPLAKRDEERFFSIASIRHNGNSTDTKGKDDAANSSTPPIRLPDPYGWMRDDSRTSSLVLDHIRRENDYTKHVCLDNFKLQQTLAKEFQRHADSGNEISQVYSAAANDVDDDYFYYYFIKRLADQPYPLHCRCLQQVKQKQPQKLNTTNYQIVLDENKIASTCKKSSRQQYFAIHSVVPSPCHRKVACSVDLLGTEIYDIFIQDVETGERKQVASGASGSIVWGTTDQQLYYVGMDCNLFRPYRWLVHNASDGKTSLLDDEPNSNVQCSLQKSMDGKFLFWIQQCPDLETARVSTLDLSTDRRVSFSFEYSLCTMEHWNGYWWALCNDDDERGATLYTAPTTQASDHLTWTRVDWTTYLEHPTDETLSINGLFVFRSSIVLQGRQEGLTRIWVLRVGTNATINHVEPVSFEEAAHYVSVGSIQDYRSDAATITFESMVSPPQILRVNLDKPNDPTSRVILHETVIPGYSKEEYACKRLEVLSRDGKTRIPVSILRRRDAQFPTRLHLLGYGAYGHSLEPAFSSMKTPLLNRGVTCAIAHVRGGGEMGSYWYRGGKGSNKMNSINDFVDVARWLATAGWTKPELLSCEGRSAGGLLVAASVNQAPDLFQSVFLGVPFLDVLASMSDPSLPLTALEYGEWGNPHTPNGYESMRSYCPMQNVKVGRKYPSTLIVASLHDPRTPYWESLKFAATLRHAAGGNSANPDHRPVCVKIDTDAGHSFGSNRTKFFEEMGFIYAFLLAQSEVGSA